MHLSEFVQYGVSAFYYCLLLSYFLTKFLKNYDMILALRCIFIFFKERYLFMYIRGCNVLDSFCNPDDLHCV
jgi:hypothetical protein